MLVMDDIVSTTCGGCICRVRVLVRRMHPQPTFVVTLFCVLGLTTGWMPCGAASVVPTPVVLTLHYHPSRVLDTFIVVVMDTMLILLSSYMWRAAAFASGTILDAIATDKQCHRNTDSTMTLTLSLLCHDTTLI